MQITSQIKEAAKNAINNLYQANITSDDILVNINATEFEGDYTVVLFPFVKQLKKSPDALGNEIGAWLLVNNGRVFSKFNIVKGFLNLSISDNYWFEFLDKESSNGEYGKYISNKNKILVEYSSPNTNKPLHLGHLRNNFLGWSIAEILKQSGNDVVKTCVVNDRGIHICKSMIAWQIFANGATPESTGEKGDHFVGDYYVKFNDEYKIQVETLKSEGISGEVAEKEAPIMKAAQQMLLDWEGGNPEVIALWKKMNSWVYAGFDETYKAIGTDFDKVYYESNTYLLGKDLIEQGLEKKVFYQKEDGSVWIDLTADGLDEKIVRRKDGTSVYITQDIGMAQERAQEYHPKQSIYVVGDEQNYHFKVLKLICQKLGIAGADGIYHLSYGMVELPSGKMKSREGTVVDADDLVDEMINIAKQKTEELGKVNDFSETELVQLYKDIGIGALKFYLLRVDPKKKMIFNPQESIDFHGFTGPFVQYTHARIKSILRKVSERRHEAKAENPTSYDLPLMSLERLVALQLEQYPSIIEEAAGQQDPSKIAIYIFNLAKTFNSFYSEHSIANAENEEKKSLRLQLATLTATVIKSGLGLLGINAPERM